MIATALTFSQVRYVNKAFWRNPSSRVLHIRIPAYVPHDLHSLLGNGTVHIGSMSVKASTYYVAAMASFGVITACYSNIAMTMAFQRDNGLLKRIDGSPLPSSSFLGTRVIHALYVALLLVAITAAFGSAF